MPSIALEHLDNYDDPIQLSSDQISTIAIIGGGASGAIALDSLLKEKPSNFSKITLFERRKVLGGVWALDEKTIETPNQIIKSGLTSIVTDPQLVNPFHSKSSSSKSEKFIITNKTTQERFEETPSYANIKTNIIEKMMTYSDTNRWEVPGVEDPEQRKYVDGLIVQKYIDKYISRNLSNDKVQLFTNSTIEDVERIPSEHKQIPYKFRLTIRSNLNQDQDIWYQEEFDSVIIATGHYHVPFIPYVKGLNILQEQFPKVIQHAKFYLDPKPYKDEKVLIIGSRASGADLSKFIADEAIEVYQSIRNLENTKKLSKKANIITKPIIKEYVILPDNSGFKVLFDDDSELINPDHIIYATGYEFSFPFLNRLTNNQIVEDGRIIPHAYQHTFLINEPLITFVGVPIDGISFRVFEYQAITVSRYLSGKIALPSRTDQKQWITNRLNEKGITRAYHTIGVVDAQEYLSGLVKLGEINQEKLNQGRQYPVLTVQDILDYRSAGELLRKFWDER
ncbi:flavin-containing monooxygenase [Scheffersomyces coipomensis]|uniref:flavin-containing monooxygenase n=1 Tax=Scheffersomyces coipomensis TaxID=1788519 RepID=UPI00315C8AF3